MSSVVPRPSRRNLRGYAVDPGLSASLSTLAVNELVYSVRWEDLEPRDQDNNESGTSYPIGEYLEIVDYDPASKRFYEPINLDDPHLLAQQGLAPSIGNPQFHQQMVYAVIMTTIENFEKALGRKIQWADKIVSAEAHKPGEQRKPVPFEYVKRLRVYPHALRQPNAYYDPEKKALLFGYFRSTPADVALQLPGSTVFTCLSHDIIAHETTHAILDGLHRRYINATNPDTRAFHEAFADIVALFQHFTFPDVLKHQIAKTRGDLGQQNILGQLAQEFGQAIGGYGSLRDAIGEPDENGTWQPHDPDPADYQTTMSFHARGSILVAAVFDAFLTIYKHRIQRVLRIASGGSGILPEGELHPDLVEQLAKYASESAQDVLQMCIRALDYCPPMDITFGDYLRAIITADIDLITDDEKGYRVAFIEAFRRRGIYPSGVRNLSVEELQYELYPSMVRAGDEEAKKEVETAISTFLLEIKNAVGFEKDRTKIDQNIRNFINLNGISEQRDKDTKKSRGKNNTKRSLNEIFESLATNPEKVGVVQELTGLRFPLGNDAAEKLGFEAGYLTQNVTTASFVIGNVWLSNRVSPSGEIISHVVVTLAQKRGVRFKPFTAASDLEVDSAHEAGKGYFVPDKTKDWGERHLIFNGGCTMVFDLAQMKLRCVVKRSMDDELRMKRQFAYQQGLADDVNETYFDSKTMTALAGPFAMMHACSCIPGEG